MHLQHLSRYTTQMMSWCRNTLFQRNNDVIIALCVRWDRTTLPLRPRLHYIKHTAHWMYCSGCWFHLGSAYLHILQPMRLITATTHGIGSILQHKKYVELLNWSTLPQHNQTINEYRSSSGLGHNFQWWNQRGPGNVAILFRIENPGENPAWYLRL